MAIFLGQCVGKSRLSGPEWVVSHTPVLKSFPKFQNDLSCASLILHAWRFDTGNLSSSNSLGCPDMVPKTGHGANNWGVARSVFKGLSPPPCLPVNCTSLSIPTFPNNASYSTIDWSLFTSRCLVLLPFAHLQILSSFITIHPLTSSRQPSPRFAVKKSLQISSLRTPSSFSEARRH